MKTSRTRATATVGGLFLAGLLAGAFTGAAAADRATDPYEGLSLFARVLTIVEQQYVDEVEQDVLVEAAVRGILDELDEHSRWLDAEQYRRFQDSSGGNYEGIGVEVRMIPEGVLVSRVLSGGPAERDGLLPGDKIISVDGESIAGFSLEQVSSRLKGPRGLAVTVTVAREGWDTPRDIKTVRDRIETPSVEGDRIDDVVYLHVSQFQDETTSELRREYKSLTKEGDPKGLILDLRDNPGGLLDQAVEVSDLFLDQGVIVSTANRVDGTSTYEATTGGFPSELPVVVLINGMSASASEIVASALQETGRATIVGTASYGKGSVQTIFENRNDTALKLTIGRYYTPSGKPVAALEGRAPDIEVPFTTPIDAKAELHQRLASLDLPELEKDELLTMLRELPVEQSPSLRDSIPWNEPASDRLESDPQLQRAMAVLRDAAVVP